MPYGTIALTHLAYCLAYAAYAGHKGQLKALLRRWLVECVPPNQETVLSKNLAEETGLTDQNAFYLAATINAVVTGLLGRPPRKFLTTSKLLAMANIGSLMSWLRVQY